jgi:uncharacterized delta-60 repeat protein
MVTREGSGQTRRHSTVLAALATAISLLLGPSSAAAHIRPGSLELSFGNRGKLTQSIAGLSFISASTFHLALGPGGGIYVLIGQRLDRYTPNGKLDTRFGNHGRVVFVSSDGSSVVPISVTVDSRGRVLVAGTTTIYSRSEHGPENAATLSPELVTVYRFTPTGQIDSSFGTNGSTSSTFGLQPPTYTALQLNEVFRYEAPEVQATGITVDSQNRPVLTGTADSKLGGCRDMNYGSVPFHEAFVARLTEGGQPDPTFNGTGVQVESGQIETYDPIVGPSDHLAYLRSAGFNCERDLLDRTYSVGRFDSEGHLEPSLPASKQQNGPAPAITIDRFGRLLLLLEGESSSEMGEPPQPYRVVRLHADGSLDTGFGRNGTHVLTHSQGTFFSGIATDSHGRVLVTGSQLHGGRFELIRLRSGGNLDRRFGRNGRVVTAPFPESLGVAGPVVDRRDRVIIGGLTYPFDAEKASMRLTRYMP